MTTKKSGASQSNTRHHRRRKPSPTKGWFSLEQRAHFKGQKEQA